MIVVSDTSPIANLLLVNKLTLLHEIFSNVIISPTVYREILALEQFGVDLTEFKQINWIQVQQPVKSADVEALRKDLDTGESEAIILALELQADWILLDERQGTKIAETFGLHPIGLVGILIKAKQQKLINAVIPVIEELRRKAGFWISDSFLSRIKELVNE